MAVLSLVILSLVSLSVVDSTPVDNGLEGEPEASCGSQSMFVNITTRAPFEGHIYVQHYWTVDKCKGRSDGSQASIELELDGCGVTRQRSIQPAGILASAVLVVSFHKEFITNIDKAIKVECFYMEADEMVTSQTLNVRKLATVPQIVPVITPTCGYDVLDGGPWGTQWNGQTLDKRYTINGHATLTQVLIDSRSSISSVSIIVADVFCMVVHDCKVDEGTGDVIELLDGDGCALDQYLLGNLEYTSDLTAGRETHVFKYIDRRVVYFYCWIRLTVKEPGNQCQRPSCSESRQKRMAADKKEEVVLDVFTPLLTV